MSAIEFTAVNTAPDSVNRIHSEEGAKEYGFKGGLVPGAATFSYICEALRWSQGDDWPDRAYVDIRYLAPVYDGEQVRVDIETSVGRSGEVSVTGPAGQVCARGVFAERDAGLFSVPAGTLPEVGAPERTVPLIGANVVEAEYLASVPVVIDSDECATYLDALGLDAGFYLERGQPHLGFLARMYTRLIAASFERVGPAIHAATELEVLRPLRFGETVSVRGRVDRLFRKRGHGYWTFEMGWVDADGRTCLRAMHTGIYDVKKRSIAPGPGPATG
jgi:acyl dehydratase